MPSSRFAGLGDRYGGEVADSIAFSGAEHDYFTRRKADELVELATRHVGAPDRLSILDVGCGVGLTDQHLVGRFGEVHGIDAEAEVVRVAAERNPDVTYTAYDGTALPYETGTFDLAFAICVLHHVEPDRRPGFAAELARVVRPDGLAVVFEHNPFNPLTRLAVSRCEFDDGVVLLTRRSVARLLAGAGLAPIEQRYVIFTTIDRPWATRAERAFRGLPVGAQHVVAGRPSRAAGPGRTGERSGRRGAAQ